MPHKEYSDKKEEIPDIPSQIGRKSRYVRIGTHSKLIDSPIVLA